jgi:hypothetical protein
MGKSLIIKVVFAMLIAFATATGLALDLSELTPIPFKWWPFITFILFTALVGWIIYGLYRNLRARDNARPNLFLHHIESPVKNIRKVIIDGSGEQKIIGNPHFTRIWIANIPKSPELGADANDVYANIQFFDASKHQVLPDMSGRWPEAGQPAGSLVTQQMKIPPNGKPFCLDIVMKYLDDDDMYGYDDFAHQLPNGKNPNTKLGVGQYFVKVTFACIGVNLPLWFQLKNPGKDYEVIFSEVSAW